MFTAVVQRLEFICQLVPGLLKTIVEEDFNCKPQADKWSKKEILGHLIDSAANNHQRFVRAQFENTPVIFYDSDKWKAAGYYQAFDGQSLILFWQHYNKHLLILIKNIPEKLLSNTCKTSEQGNPLTIRFLIEDYVSHLEHHLKQLGVNLDS